MAKKVFLMSVGLLIFSLAFISSAPVTIVNCSGLQAMKDNLAGSYVLGNNIDCSDTVNWNDGEGFIPIGQPHNSLDSAKMFSGRFDGGGYKITNLYINRPDENFVGLFGYVGYTAPSGVVIISDLVVKNATIISDDSDNTNHATGVIGVLQYANLDGCSITDTFIEGGYSTGGIVGVANNGNIYNCDFDGIVIGNVRVAAGVGGSAGSMYNTEVSGEVYGLANYSGLYGWTDSLDPPYPDRDYNNCVDNTELYPREAFELAIILNDHEGRIKLLESWKKTIVNTLSTISSQITALVTKNTEQDSRLKALENKNISGNVTIINNTIIKEYNNTKTINTTVFVNSSAYLKYLSSSDRKAMVCGYAEDNKMKSYNDLGWNCNITYKTYSGRTTSSCSCKSIK